MVSTLLLGDNLDLLKKIPDNSIDSIVTDPPYGLRLMGEKWDYDVPTVALWQECLRVLKPGGSPFGLLRHKDIPPHGGSCRGCWV